MARVGPQCHRGEEKNHCGTYVRCKSHSKEVMNWQPYLLPLLFFFSMFYVAAISVETYNS